MALIKRNKKYKYIEGINNEELSDFFHKGFYDSFGGRYEFSQDIEDMFDFISDKEVEEIKKRRELKEFTPSEKWRKVDGGWILDSYPLLGQYVFDKKKIIIYEKSIENCCEGKSPVGFEKHKYIVTTFLQLLFYAYFHKECSNIYRYILELTVPMAVLGTLTYLDSLGKQDEEIFDFAWKNAIAMKDEIGRLSAYGFGAWLYDTLETNDRYELIRKIINKITFGEIDEDDQDLQDYKKMVRVRDYDESYKLLENILQK